MRKFFLLWLVPAFGVQFSFGQKCVTPELIKHRESELPGYEQAVQQAFDYAKSQVPTGSRNSGEVLRLRTVVHIVSTSPQEDLPDSLVYSQIEVLNRDYRRLNPDSVNTRVPFLPVAADAGIEFVLADTDPDGNPTNGITRTNGSPGFLGFTPFDDNVKSAASGGKDPWPTDRYLNIWVCNILMGIGVLGYAYPPADLPNWPAGSAADSAKQGVVIHYAAFGRNNPFALAPEVAGGRTAVHEVGHYLGLRHIWGDDQGLCDGQANAGSDGISDTPDSGDSQQQSCNQNANTCGAGNAGDFPDMIENYMDYSDERCQNMFTREQVDLMRSSIEVYRPLVKVIYPLFVQSLAYQPLSVYPNPASDRVHLSGFPESLQMVQIIDLTGRNCGSLRPVKDGTFTIEDLQPGSYSVYAIAQGMRLQGRLNVIH